MENRFGFRDLVLCSLMVVIVVVLLLQIKQFDRQWEVVQAVNEKLDLQTRQLVQIDKAIRQGGTVIGSAGGTSNGAGEDTADTFASINLAQASEDYAQGDWLVQSFGTTVPKLTPLVSSDVYGSIIQARVVETLVYTDPYTLEPVPLLARSWQVSDDGLSITFQLRRGVTFSDGEGFDADDVVFTFNWIMNPQVNAPRARAYFEKIDAAEKINQYEVIFRYSEPYFESFNLAATMDILPEHFYSRYTPDEFNLSTGLLMGTGPYRLASPTDWKPGKPLELVRNERYWGEPGPFDKVVYRIIANDPARYTTFINGELDIFGAQPEQYEEMIKDEQLSQWTDHLVFESIRGGYTYIAWNQQRNEAPTPFADQRVRLAMTLLTDRQRMCDEMLLGYAIPATGPFNHLGKQADPGIEPWPYDPEQAIQLLKQAGYADRDGDGLIESPQGVPLQFKLIYPANSELYERIALFLKDDYARAGIAMEPDPADWPILIKKLESRDFDAISLGWSGGIESDIYQMFHSSQITAPADNFMGYANEPLDQFIEQARATVDPDKRMPLWQQCHRIIHEDQPYTFLFRRKALVFFDNRIKNIQRTQAGLNWVETWPMPIPWYVPDSSQKWTQ